MHIRAAIVDFYNNCFIVGRVVNKQSRTEWEARMGSADTVGIKALTVSSWAAMVTVTYTVVRRKGALLCRCLPWGGCREQQGKGSKSF